LAELYQKHSLSARSKRLENFNFSLFPLGGIRPNPATPPHCQLLTNFKPTFWAITVQVQDGLMVEGEERYKKSTIALGVAENWNEIAK
jgi:hypothetical protein